MRKLVYLIGVVLCFGTAACNGGKSKEPQQPPRPKATTPAPPKAPREAGKVFISEPISGSTSTYAYYLPLGYTHEKPRPLIVFFDSHARGKEPVTRYQSLADQYGMILVGSNNSRNGQQPNQSLAIYDELIRDVKTKFAVDEQRITASGFSGGARVAATIAQNRPGVKSVIACSAGFQPHRGDAFNYYAIVGLEDFNYQELRQLEGSLDQTQQPHVVTYWNGGHAWPEAGIMGDAFQFVYLRGLDPADQAKDSLVQAAMEQFEMANVANEHSPLARWRCYKSVIARLGGLMDVGFLKSEMEQLQASATWLEEQALEENVAVEENALRETYVPLIPTKGVNEWRKLANGLRTAHSDKQLSQHQTDMRVLNFLSLNTYFQVDGALKAGDLPQAEHFLQIYALIDPTNPEHAYLTAVVRMRQGRQGEALKSLQAAQRLGFKDAERMATDPELAQLKDKSAFTQLLEQIRGLQ